MLRQNLAGATRRCPSFDTSKSCCRLVPLCFAAQQIHQGGSKFAISAGIHPHCRSYTPRTDVASRTYAHLLDSSRVSSIFAFGSLRAQATSRYFASEGSRLRQLRISASVLPPAFDRLALTMPSADPNRALPGGGPAPLITLKTHPPLPFFSIPHRVPDPSTEISSFKLSILRILTGQTNAQSSTKPLTYSEEVKEKAINDWKMQMLTLELRQRDDFEAEEQSGDSDQVGATSGEMCGFELQDHHECSLIEEGDQIVVRLKPNHKLEELELPKLGPNHRDSVSMVAPL